MESCKINKFNDIVGIANIISDLSVANKVVLSSEFDVANKLFSK